MRKPEQSILVEVFCFRQIFTLDVEIKKNSRKNTIFSSKDKNFILILKLKSYKIMKSKNLLSYK
jgi:hypothetical protein